MLRYTHLETRGLLLDGKKALFVTKRPDHKIGDIAVNAVIVPFVIHDFEQEKYGMAWRFSWDLREIEIQVPLSILNNRENNLLAFVK